MTTLDRYLIKKLVLHTLLVGAALGFLFFLAASYRLLQHEGLSLAQVSRAAPLVVPFLLPYMLPVTYVIALTLVYGRLVADGEVTAFAALGVPPAALARPAILLSGVLYGVSVLLTGAIVPYCYRARRAVYEDTYLQLAAAGDQSNLTLSFPHQGIALYVRHLDETGLHGVVIRYARPVEPGDPASGTVLLAERGRIVRDAAGQSALELSDVTATYLDRGRAPQPGVPDASDPPRPLAPPVRAQFDDLTLRLGSLGQRYRLKASAYSTVQLRRRIVEFRRTAATAGDTLEGKLAAWELNTAELEIADRVVTAGASIVLTLLTVPLVFLLRARSALVPLAVGLSACAALFFAPHMVGAFLGEQLSSPIPVFLSWVTGTAGGAVFWFLGRRP